jgi:hypothetical protein
MRLTGGEGKLIKQKGEIELREEPPDAVYDHFLANCEGRIEEVDQTLLEDIPDD